VAAHRMTDECYFRRAELRDERFEIAVERADLERFGMVAVTVAAEVEAHDPEALGQ